MNKPRPATAWKLLDWLVVLLLFGYTTLGRSFAHWGVPPLFIGEVSLAAFAVFRPFATFGPALAALLRPDAMSTFTWCVYLSLCYGVIETFRGLYAATNVYSEFVHRPSATLQNLVFHIYPFYVWVGLNVGRRLPDFLPRLILPLSWAGGVYGILYFTVLAPRGLTNTTDMYEIGMFGQPNWSAVLMLLLLSFPLSTAQVGPPLLLNGFVFLAAQSRATWLSTLACLPVWGVLSGNIVNVLRLIGAVALLLLVGWIIDFRMPSPASRHGGEISIRQLAAQTYAIIDPKAVARLRNVEARAGTIGWRTGWWKEIYKFVHGNPLRAAIGPGYGFPIWELHPEGTDDFPLRTPHNVVMYALGYTGWVGVLCLLLVQASLGAVLWRSYLDTQQPFGICLWLACLLRSLFDNFYESPQFAIVFYLLVGLALALPARASGRELHLAGGVP